MVAGPGFEPGMLLAYETGVVAALPAIILRLYVVYVETHANSFYIRFIRINQML